MEALYPVFFTYEEVVKGNRFLASVQARGRALMVNEDGEWTMYGVQPGSFAESGETFEEARLLFRQTFREILYDLAEDYPGFQSFKAETERILGEVNDPMRERWDSAVERIRADRASMEEPIKSLPVVQAQETTAEFRVLQLVPANSSANNRIDKYELVRAA